MSLTILGTTPSARPVALAAPRIYLREKWRDAWEEFPQLQHVRHSMSVGAANIAEAEFISRYGQVRQPFETQLQARDPLDIRDFWVRIDVLDPLDGVSWQTQFVGIVYNDVKVMQGNFAQLRGEQPWVAYGPQKILDNIRVSTSFWLDADEEVEIGHLPSMNGRDKRRLHVGNRSVERGNGELSAYLFGGKELWSNFSMLEYILERHVLQDDGPDWEISGQSDILEDITDNIEFGRVENVGDILKKLMKRQYALDYKIVYTGRGFSIHVFTQLGEDSNFGSTVLPLNPDVVRYDQGYEFETSEIKVVRSRAQMFDRIRIIGKPVVMCASFGGSNAGLDEGSGAGELQPDWLDDIETEYLAGRGDGYDVDKQDEARRRDKYKAVYQAFAAPEDWDHRAGLLSPQIGLDGTILDEPADFQNSVRETLSWLPMFRDYDYSQDPAVDNRETDADPELQAPAAYLFDDGEDSDVAGYIECDKHGISVSAPHHNLGILVNAAPNHLLAKNHAFEEGSDEEDTTDHDPLYDYGTLSCTIAWETSARLQVGYDVPEALQVGDGSIETLVFEDAELWLLAPNTIVGVDETGALLNSGPDLRVLRNDVDRLELIAAGVIGTYVNERVRSEMTRKGFWAWGDYLGRILQVVEAGAIEFVGAPITTMEWISSSDGKIGTMTVRTGYA